MNTSSDIGTLHPAVRQDLNRDGADGPAGSRHSRRRDFRIELLAITSVLVASFGFAGTAATLGNYADTTVVIGCQHDCSA